MKAIEVVAAVIRRDGRILATQRGYGDLAGGWEFPGGKLEAGETPEQALVREIDEELGVNVSVGRLVTVAYYEYDTFCLRMCSFLCEIAGGEIELREHSDARWLDADELDSVGWLPADIQVIDEIRRQGIV